jgi:hypothetical protein
MSIKRMVVLLLVVGIAVLGLLAIRAGTAEPDQLVILATGIVLGIIYLVRGGSLPDWIHRYFNVNAEDDPSNLPPRIYLPILIAVLVIASLAYLKFGR